MQRIIGFVKSLVGRYFDHHVAEISGQLAYFLLMSLFPFLIFFNAVIGLFHLSATRVTELFAPIFPAEVVNFLGMYIESITQNSSTGILSVSIIVSIFSASRAVRSLDYSINVAYGTEDKRHFVVKILFSMLFIICLALIIAILIVFAALSGEFIEHLSFLSEGTKALIYGLKPVVTFVILLFAISLLYYYMPGKKVSYKSVLPGTLFTLLCFMVLTFGFTIYATYIFSDSAVYGSLGTIILLLLWLYLASNILVLGAEINSLFDEQLKKSEG